MITALIFIAVLAVLVLSHEWGHFIAARKSGMKVDEFGFGFPPRLFGIRRSITPEGKKKWEIIWRYRGMENPATLYTINLLPLGGFVKIKGEDASGNGATDPDSFNAKSFWKKAIVLLAGVFMNVFVAWVLLSIVLMIGYTSPTETGPNTELQIVQVLPGKPAAEAGLKVGDIITRIDTTEDLSVDSFQQFVQTNGTKSVSVTVRRGSETLEKTMTPIVYEDTHKPGIGIAIADVSFVRYPWYTAWYHGLRDTGMYIWMILASFAGIIRGIFAGGAALGDVSGPVGIAVMTGEAARLGIVYLLQLTALISLNLAILNALPIPALDGGRLFFLVLSKIFRKKNGFKYEGLIHTVVFLLLLVVVVLITIKDIRTFSI